MKGKLKKTGFTMIELLVAVSVLVVILSTTSVIFKVCIESQRKATALSEIMRNLRGITDQLNRDFAGLQKDAPIAIWFQRNNGRYDQMMFFASGDFQSLGSAGTPVISGNLARVYYGHADTPVDAYNDADTLARRQHILTADTTLLPVFPGWNGATFNAWSDTNNNELEYDMMSLSAWKTVPDSVYSAIVMPSCLNLRATVDMTNSVTLKNIMCQGVSIFKIQVERWYPAGNRWVWWPDTDIYGDGSVNNFPLPTNGYYFNVSSGSGFFNWTYQGSFGYRAIKFTFTLEDSNGVLDGGRVFTHIVYID